MKDLLGLGFLCSCSKQTLLLVLAEKQDGKKLCNTLVYLVTSFCLHQS